MHRTLLHAMSAQLAAPGFATPGCQRATAALPYNRAALRTVRLTALPAAPLMPPRSRQIHRAGSALLVAIFYIAISANITSALAQKQPESTAACPAAAEMGHLHLRGSWIAQLQAPAQPEPGSALPPPAATAVLQLGPHPELAHSVRGTVRRGNATALVSGDVDEGDLTLEESINGTNISATWTGRVVDGSCGKEIRGTWNNATPTPTAQSAPSAPSAPFVLRKQPGWQ